MNRKHSALRALLFASAATLLATGAWAQNPNAAAPAKANAADKANKVPDKADKAADKADGKLAKSGTDGMLKGTSVEDRAARKAKERDAQRAKLGTAWKGPVNDALRQELRRHAERLARLERIKLVAEGEKDSASVEKANKLVSKENERHEAWLAKHASATGETPAASPAPAAAAAKKEGAQ